MLLLRSFAMFCVSSSIVIPRSYSPPSPFFLSRPWTSFPMLLLHSSLSPPLPTAPHSSLFPSSVLSPCQFNTLAPRHLGMLSGAISFLVSLSQ